MTWRVDTKSVALGVVLGAGLWVLVGAAKNEPAEPAGPVGRYQICCGANTAYLVDTITGQVWLNSEREFRMPKLATKPASGSPAAESLPTAEKPAVQSSPTTSRPRTGPSAFLGKWVLTHPTEGQLGIQIKPDGQAVLTEGDKNWEGKWRIEGNQITIDAEGESMTARLDEQGRLLLKENGSEPIPFQRAE